MTLRIFTPEEDAVFEQIAKQRANKGPDEDYFIYSITDGQKELQSNNNAISYGIGISEQTEIIRELIKDKVLDADWIVSPDPQNAGEYILKYHDDKWLHDKFSASSLVSIVFGELDYNKYFFMQLGFGHIKAINDSCRAIYPCELLYDEDQCCFYVERKDTGEIYYIRKLKSTMRPFKVLLAAFNTPHKHATRAYLNGEGRPNIGKSSITTRVFAKNSVVRNELSPLVELNIDDITIKTGEKLTLDQLKALKKA